MSPALLAIAGFDGYLRRFNPAFALFGYSREELLSQPWIEFAHPADREQTAAATGSLEPGSDVVEFENRVVCRDGSLRWVQWKTRVVAEEGLYYAAGTDVTETRRAAAEQAALRRVATLVARRTAPDAVLAAVAREVGEVLGVAATHLGRFEADGTIVSVGQWPLDRGVPVGARFPLEGDSVSTRVLRSGRPARMDSYARAPGAIAAAVRDVGIRFSIGVPIRVDGQTWGVMIVSTRAQEAFSAETESRLQDFTELLSTAISNASAHDRLSELADEQAALTRVATLVAQQTAQSDLFAAIAEETARLLQVASIQMMRYDDGRVATAVAGWGPHVPTVPAETREPLGGRNVTSLVFQTGRAARLDDYAEASGAIAMRVALNGVRRAVGAPIFVEGRLWGVMIAASTDDDALPPGTEARLGKFTELMATAIAKADSRDQLRASRARVLAAADDARRQVVRDLHDGAQQRLVHSIFTLKLALQALRDHGADAESLVAQALEYAEGAISDLRELSHGILPVGLIRGGLGSAVDAFVSRLDLPVDLEVSTERLPRDIEASAYFIIAEALTNVVKHARATRAKVSTALDDTHLRLEVRDNGTGGADPEGFGLVGIADRVDALGGELTIESADRGGTVVSAQLPLAT